MITLKIRYHLVEDPCGLSGSFFPCTSLSIHMWSKLRMIWGHRFVSAPAKYGRHSVIEFSGQKRYSGNSEPQHNIGVYSASSSLQCSILHLQVKLRCRRTVLIKGNSACVVSLFQMCIKMNQKKGMLSLCRESGPFLWSFPTTTTPTTVRPTIAIVCPQATVPSTFTDEFKFSMQKSQ